MGVYAQGMFALASTGLALGSSGFARAEIDPETAIRLVKAGATLLRWNNWAGLISIFLGSWLATKRPRL